MTAIVSRFFQSNAFGFASFYKKRYLAKVDRNVKTYCTKCIDGFVTLISSLNGYLVRLYIGAMMKIARILSMLYIPLVNA